MTDQEVSTAGLLIESLRDCGVDVIFANFGSDHPSIIEALASDREHGITTPAVIVCPHEYSALSAAHGYAAATGRPQAVFVHTDVGTANLGGAVHNAARSHVPVFIFAGLTPYTLEGELPGTRNTHINHLQDTPDQQGLVRSYVKWSYDIRTGRNVQQLVRRALQLAMSSPRGPVYLTGAREVLAERVQRPDVAGAAWPPVESQPARADLVDRVLADLEGAERPVIVTSYLGRNPDSVPKLVALAERLSVPVVEACAEHLNFPADHAMHLGDEGGEIIADADAVLAIDTDAPWIPSLAAPANGASVTIVDADPLKESLPLWYLAADRFIRADSGLVLDQLHARLDDRAAMVKIDPERRQRRLNRAEAMHRKQRATWREALDADVEAGRLTAAVVADTLKRVLDDDAILVNEAITNSTAVSRYLSRNRPGTVFSNRGTSLGWSGGGALGIKLAMPDRVVVSIVGDGTYHFSVPSSTYWIAERYRLPVLTVVLDNGGWNATKRNVHLQHPGGTADRTDRYWVNLTQSADLPGIATAAGAAWGETVAEPKRLQPALETALGELTAGRSAVVAVQLTPISEQAEDVFTGTSSPPHLH